MKNVVITGSTRGIGLGMARAFLSAGCRVTVCGRTAGAVEKATTMLARDFDAEMVAGFPCDVTCNDQLHGLWQAAVSRWGSIDIWINNAGIGQPWLPFWEIDPQTAEAVVNTNILGVMNGTRVAIKGMLEQGRGMIVNMEGYGSDGRTGKRLGIYGSTKRSVRYFSRAMSKELESSPLLIGTLSPGMVVTDFLMAPLADYPDGGERAKRIFNILADSVETVAPFLVKKILAANRTGFRIAWLTRAKVFRRFLFAGFSKRDLFKN
jgi:NAD(P)-dependent dehydrogenase (short-subunit alcohol dehydrogenase family)